MENEALSGKSLPIILIGGGKLQPIRERILVIIERWSAVISSAGTFKVDFRLPLAAIFRQWRHFSWNAVSGKISFTMRVKIFHTSQNNKKH